MKIKALLGIFLLFTLTSYGQNVGIGTSSPAALLDIYSTSDGVLIPRVALTGTGSASPLSSPTTSILVYNTATAGSGATSVSPGFYYWNGSAWVRFIDNGSLTGSTTVSNTSSANTISTTVNGVTGSTVPIINTNTLGLSGTTLTSTINGVASNGQDLSSLDNNIYNSDGTLTGNRTVTMSGNVLDFAGGNVGIGTSSPAQLLDVNGTTKTISFQMTNGATTGYLLQSDASGNGTWTNPATALSALGTGTQNYVTKWNNAAGTTIGNSQIYDNGIRVGIGTSSPSTTLHVNGSITMGTPGNGNQNLQFSNGSGYSQIQAIDPSVAYDGLALNPNGGYVGIGNTSPDRPLTIQGSPTNNDLISYKDNGGTTRWHMNMFTTSGSSTGHYDLNFAETGIIDGRLYLQAGGNVGINSTAPAATLDVNGPLRVQGAQATHSQGVNIEWNKNSGDGSTWFLNQKGVGTGGFTFGEVSTANVVTTRMLIDASGNVGIGTTSPAQKLDVAGTTRTTNFQMTNGGTNGYILKSDASGNASWVNPASITTATTVSNTSSANTLSTTVNGVTGSTVPVINSNTLGLSGTTLTSTINGVASNTLDISSVANNIYNSDGTLTGNRTVTMSGNTLNFTGGNVGIGQSNPAGPLDVNGRASATSFKVSSSFTDLTNNAPWYGIGLSNVTLSGQGSTAVQIGGYYGITFAESGSTRMVINRGNVGIGTSDPQAPLEIQSSVASGTEGDLLRLNSVNGGGGNGAGILFTNNGDINNLARIAGLDDGSWGGNLAFYAAAPTNASPGGTPTVKMTILGTGNVGIGTTTPGSTLDVNGAICNERNWLYLAGPGDLNHAVGNLLSYNGNDAEQFRYCQYLEFVSGCYGVTAVHINGTNGYMGIGTTSPGNLLDVQGGNIDASGYIQAGGTGGGAILFSGTTAQNGGAAGGGCSYYGRPRIGDWGNWLTIGEPNGTNGGMIMQIQGGAIYTGTSTGITASPTLRNCLDNGSGWVGIGTTSPGAALDVETANYSFNEGSYKYLASGGTGGSSCSSCNVSIYTPNRMEAAEFDANSDRRIKKDITPLSATTSLEEADRLKVVTFRYIDPLSKGNKNKTGFIAQEVETVLPNAVNQDQGFIPNVFEMAARSEIIDKALVVTTTKVHDFAAGDQVRIYDKDNKANDVIVSKVISVNEFTVAGWTGGSDSLFIYGKKVYDYRNVDYDQITAVAIGAIQELNKKVNEEQIKNRSLEQKISKLEKQNTDSKSDIDKLKASVEALQQMVETRAQK